MTAPYRTTRHAFLASTRAIVDEARNGRMVVLINDEGPENEGDIVIPAQMATPAVIDFMTTHGGGPLCLALDKERVDQLGLDLVSPKNRKRGETPSKVSIRARGGAAGDNSPGARARTISAAIDAARGAEYIAMPGHVFPLVARPGGVLVRAGHIEASVDISRLAGLNPSSVICEVRNEDGTPAHLEELVAFAELHGLKIGTIRDLIAYRRLCDSNIERVAEARFVSRWGGEWTAMTFRNKTTEAETLALAKGHLDPSKPTLVRMHPLGLFDDVLGMEGERGGLLERSMVAIAEEGAGIVVLLEPENSLSEVIRLVGRGQAADMVELRDYGVGAQILADFGIHDMVLLTNSHHTLIALDGYGLNIVEQRLL